MLKNKSLKTHAIFILLIFILGLTPLLWFKPDQVITGTDVDFPLFPQKRLQDRIYTWFPKILGGSDRSNNVSSLPYVISTYIFDSFTNNSITAEKLTFVFWFMLSGIGIYYLLNALFKDDTLEANVSKFLGILLYMFNFYQVFMWVRLQLSVSILFLLPVFLGILINITENGLNKYKGAFYLSVAAILSGTLGLQPPLMFSLFITLGLYVLYYTFIRIKFYGGKNWYRAIVNLVLLTAVFVWSSLYWMLPLLNFISGSGYSDSGTGMEVYSVVPLLNWVSSITSFTNLYRFFGDVPWFDGWNGESYSPEFLPYLKNPLLVTLSFIPVFFAFLPLLLAKLNVTSKKDKDKDSDVKHQSYNTYIFFCFVYLVGLWFSKGVHYPLGRVFLWMVKTVPLFWIHRAPWQKFSVITLLAFSVMLTYAFMVLFRTLRESNLKKNIPYYAGYTLILGALVTFFILSYNYLFVFGKMFPSKEETVGYHGKFDLGFHHKFPDYVYTAGEFVNADKSIYKIALLPQDNTSVYTWGYAGAGDVTNLVFDKGTIQSQYGEGFAPPSSIENVYTHFVNSVYGGQSSGVSDLLGLMNVRYILLRGDFRHDFFGDTDSPELLKTKLGNIDDITQSESIGKWDFFRIADKNYYPLIYIPQNKISYTNGSEILPYVIKDQSYPGSKAFFASTSDSQAPFAATYLRASSLRSIESAEITFKWDSNYLLPETSISPKSLMYKLLKLKENIEIDRKSNDLQKAELLSWLGAKRILEMQNYELTKSEEALLVKDFLQKTDSAISILKTTNELEKNSKKYMDVSEKVIIYIQKSLEDLSTLDISLTDLDADLTNFKEFLSWYRTTLEGCKGFCYGLNVLKSGVYDLSIQTHLEEKNNFFPVTINIKNEKEGTSIEMPNTQEDEVKNLTLSEGIYKISVLPQSLNAKIDNTTWKKLPVTEASNILLQIPDIRQLMAVYELDEVSYKSLDSYSGVTEYSLSFDYGMKSGNLGIVLIEESNNGKLRPVLIDRYEKTPECNTSVLFKKSDFDPDCLKKVHSAFKSSVDGKKLHVYMFSFSNFLESSVFALQNFSINKVVKPELILTLQQGIAPTEKSIPTISFFRVNPTKYKVLIENATEPFDLVFSESFHSGWKAYLNKYPRRELYPTVLNTYFSGLVKELVPMNIFLNSTLFETTKLSMIDDKDHLLVNGFANSWHVVPPSTEFEVILEFKSQRFFYMGLIGTFVSLVCFSIVFIISLIRKRPQ